jgi:5-methyltetrahydropteroyltriglutamate--homocysteine methyltransferase
MSASAEHAAGQLPTSEFERLAEEASINTLRRFEAPGSPVITDGEQTKSSFATYPLEGLDNLRPGGVVIPFADGHTRRLPRLVSGPFRYAHHADEYLT